MPPLHTIFFYLTFLFIVVFPKGGIKVGGVPLTFGYLFLGFFSLFCIRKETFKISYHQLIKLAAFVPLQALFIYKLLCFGEENLGFAIACLVNFLFLPFCFYFLLTSTLEKLDFGLFQKWLSRSILFLSLYGIFLFFYKILKGHFIELPLLTVNLQDKGMLETTKCIDRGGGLFKLISTYNNGNLFGVCMLMWLPLYYQAESRLTNRLIFRAALLLTLSRTVWYGALFAEILYYFYTCKIHKTTYLKISAVLSFYMTSIFYLNSFLNKTASFLVDYSLGGRVNQFLVLDYFTLMPSQKPFSTILEIVYLGILDELGLFGLFAFLLAMVTPIVLGINARGNKAMIAGLTIYLFVATSDGTLLLIPTMAVYLFLAHLASKHLCPTGASISHKLASPQSLK